MKVNMMIMSNLGIMNTHVRFSRNEFGTGNVSYKNQIIYT